MFQPNKETHLMFIQITTNSETFKLHFTSTEDFESFQEQIIKALLDRTETKSVQYSHGENFIVFPSLLLKNSVIKVVKDED